MTCIHEGDPGKLSNLPKWLKPHLKHHLQLKTKKEVGGSGSGFKGRKAVHMEMVEQMLGKQMFPGPGRGNGTQRGMIINRHY